MADTLDNVTNFSCSTLFCPGRQVFRHGSRAWARFQAEKLGWTFKPDEIYPNIEAGFCPDCSGSA